MRITQSDWTSQHYARFSLDTHIPDWGIINHTGAVSICIYNNFGTIGQICKNLFELPLLCDLHYPNRAKRYHVTKVSPMPKLTDAWLLHYLFNVELNCTKQARHRALLWAQSIIMCVQNSPGINKHWWAYKITAEVSSLSPRSHLVCLQGFSCTETGSCNSKK